VTSAVSPPSFNEVIVDVSPQAAAAGAAAAFDAETWQKPPVFRRGC
jgi:hypothetical protein